MIKNILTKPFTTEYGTAPFSNIKNEAFLPAFKQAIIAAKAEIDAITNNKETPSFTNTIEALDFSGEQLDRISSIFFNLNSAETNDTIQKIAQEVSPLLSEFSNDVALNEELIKKSCPDYQKVLLRPLNNWPNPRTKKGGYLLWTILAISLL